MPQPAYTTPSLHKSTAKPLASSSRYQNGDSIVLPEIATDLEDEVAKDSWENTPALLMQEKMDPASVFGPPQINLEDVFRSTEHTDSAQKPWLVRLH